VSFKTAIQEYGKEITASFVCGGVTYHDNEIISMIPHYDGKLFSSVMRCLDIQLDGKELKSVTTGAAIAGQAIVGQAIVGGESDDSTVISTPKLGVKSVGDMEYSYKTFGTYIIKSQKYDDEAGSLELECYDLMLLSMIPYDIELDYSTGTITVKGLLDAICNRLGWKIGYDTFTNSDVVIDGEKFDSSYTFRDVLDQIAQVAAGVIAFKDDELCVLYPTSSGEIIDASNLRSLKIGEMYGPVNSVVLARTPQEDNIYAQDALSIETNGLTEVKIENNQIMDSHREDFIDAILDRVNGLQFWLYELESFGIGYLDLCDKFTLETLDGTRHETLMLADEMQISQSLGENSSLEAPEATETDYAAASTTDRALNKTILKVDKQAQQITALVSRTDSLEAQVTHMTEVMIDSDSVDIKISKAVGGIDSVTTSTGYTFDEDGLKISKDGEPMENLLDNTGMHVTRDGEEILTADHEGVKSLNLTSRKFLIVGDNSRFENYDDGTGGRRTACFYIGG
jgi:hypothetical protein